MTKQRGTKKGQKLKKWKGADLEFLKATYMFMSDSELAKILGRSEKTIHSVRRFYGLMKESEQAKKLEQQLIRIPVVFVLPREFRGKRELLLDFLNRKGNK